MDRKTHILSEFNGRTEFDIKVVEAIENVDGALGLWNTIKFILDDLADSDSEFIILCEDDMRFTQEYSEHQLLSCIERAKSLNADVLCGGISWCSSSIQVSDNLFWAEKFSGLQFTVIFKNFFKVIQSAVFAPGDAADYKISQLSDCVLFIYPFISTQKDFGYSDVTIKNDTERRVEKLFTDTEENIQILRNLSSFYQTNLEKAKTLIDDNTLDSVVIPTYVINLAERTDRKIHIEKEFADRHEFEIIFIPAIKHRAGNYGLWLSIRKAVQIALDNDDDVIVICEDDHMFTETYSKNTFIQSVIEAHYLGAEILCGGIGGFGTTIPVTRNKWWINSFFCSQFVVLYKSAFKKVLDEPFDEHITADAMYSIISSSKMTLFPFISIQKDFGYSDIATIENRIPGPITQLFNNTEKRFKKIYMSVQDKINL